VVEAEEGKGVLDGMAAFYAKEDGEPALRAGGEDIVRGCAEGEVLWVSADLLEDGVEQDEGAMRVAVAPLFGLGPEGEERAGEVAFARGVEAEMAFAAGRREVPEVVGEALWGVYVGVDDEGGVMDV
jgi:hypothetical protein